MRSVVVAAEGGRARGVDRGEPAAEIGLVSRAARLEPFEGEQAWQPVDVEHAEDLRDPEATWLAEPAQGRGLGRELPRGGVRAGLDERSCAVFERGRVRVVDVSAAGPGQRCDAAAGGAGDRLLELHTRSAARSSSSSPRQAASTMSSTVSKPRSPP